MQFYELQDPRTRPVLYFQPEDIINRAPCQPSSFWIYLEENFLDFFGEIDDANKTLEYFQIADQMDNKKMHDTYPLNEYIPSYLAGRAILNFNNNSAPTKFFNMAAPTVFRLNQKLEDTKEKMQKLSIKPLDMA